MIKTAAIVAAGKGSRLKDLTSDRPKGFLEIDHIPIIEHSIKKLLDIGIEQIIIGTGYRKEEYEKLQSKYPQIKCTNNSNFESTGSMYTLYLLKNDIKEDFLLLESDLIYEKQALDELTADHHSDVILASGFTNSGDEVFIETNEYGHLLNMSKKLKYMTSVCGELIGISKLSYSTYEKLCLLMEEVEYINPNLDYEQALVGISGSTELNVLKLPNVIWCEVDDEVQWKRALDIIYPIIKAKEAISTPLKRNILLNPGPATTTDTVKYAQVVPDICPRESEFGDVMDFISTELTKFVAPLEEYTTILFGGSGTAAVESILSSVIDQKAVVIINNGAYGKRMCEIAEAYQLKFFEFKSSIAEPINLVDLENFIQSCAIPISYLAVVHNETTTGLLNPLRELGKLCKKYSLDLIVDTMSSYAAIPIAMKEMNISYLAASSNKNLQGMAGVSFVIANKANLESTKHLKPRNVYLHLYSQFKHFELTKQMRFTPPVQTLYALKQAILETKREGIENRYARYVKSWETLIDGITRLGLSHLVKREHHSKIITSILEPANKNYNFKQMHDFFYSKGFTIYPGKFESLNTFRISNIGDTNDQDIKEFIALLEQYLKWIK